MQHLTMVCRQTSVSWKCAIVCFFERRENQLSVHFFCRRHSWTLATASTWLCIMTHQTLRTLNDSGICLCIKSNMAGCHLAAKDSSVWTLFFPFNLNTTQTQRNPPEWTLGHSALYHCDTKIRRLLRRRIKVLRPINWNVSRKQMFVALMKE